MKRIHLRKARESKRLTQEQLAERLGWKQSRISALENTIDNPTIDTVRALAEELDVDPLALMFGQESVAS